MKQYKANFNFFDKIDDPKKAYWLGFIWSDGYVAKRERLSSYGKTRTEYNLKLSVQESDAVHIQKFLNDIESNYSVKFYETSGFKTSQREARAFVTNLHMGALLYEGYGIIPNRHDVSKVLASIPESLYRYFILGVFDADGSFSEYSGEYGDKMRVTFGGSAELLNFIESVLVKEGIAQAQNRKLLIRHEGKDGTWRSIAFSGIPQASKILNWLYGDSEIHLDRKYEKYLRLKFLREERDSRWANRK